MLVDDYAARLRHYLPLQCTILRQADEWTQHLMPGDKIVVCDERGEMMSSQALSQSLAHDQMHAVKRVVFLVGGPEGHKPMVRERAHHVLSFSPMTLPHEFAHVILLEQLYRAMTILKGEPYHK